MSEPHVERQASWVEREQQDDVTATDSTMTWCQLSSATAKSTKLQEALRRQRALSSTALREAAQPQMLGEQAIWPEHWGLTRQQIKDLLLQLRVDPQWRADNNVYTLVHDFVIPWTKDTGLGYALSVNKSGPKEVNVMISHAWGENAEDFLEAVLRSTSETDVVFICALSLYQAEDTAGPSIVKQIGAQPLESPFRRVLEHILRQGQDAGWRWRWREFLAALPGWCLFAAAVLFCVPTMRWGCIPTFDFCAHQEMVTRPDGNWMVQWQWTRQCPGFRIFLILVFFFLSCAILAQLALWRLETYAGRMLVVPNRECDIYGRLWCVYEIFVAKHLNIGVPLARSMASAGVKSSQLASCTSPEDQELIYREIQQCSYSFTQIDKAVSHMLHGRLWDVAGECLSYSAWLGLLCVECCLVSTTMPRYPGWVTAALFVAQSTMVAVLYAICRRAQGLPSSRSLLCCGLSFMATGISCGILQHVAADIRVVREIAEALSVMVNSCAVAILAIVLGGTSKRLQRVPRVVAVVAMATCVLFLGHFIGAMVRVAHGSMTLEIPVNLLIHGQLQHCDVRAHPYLCGVRGVSHIVKSIAPAYVLHSAALKWGIRLQAGSNGRGGDNPNPQCAKDGHEV